jgi:hypothetical protein
MIFPGIENSSSQFFTERVVADLANHYRPIALFKQKKD